MVYSAWNIAQAPNSLTPCLQVLLQTDSMCVCHLRGKSYTHSEINCGIETAFCLPKAQKQGHKQRLFKLPLVSVMKQIYDCLPGIPWDSK